MNLKRIWVLIKESVSAWVDDYAPSMGAAISYYTLFSIAPLLVIVIGIAGIVFGAEAAQGAIVAQLSGLIGEEGAVAVQGLLESASKPGHGIVATIVGVITLVIGATTVFGELQSALDRVWEVPAAKKTGGIWSLLRQRLLSLGMVLVFGLLMLVSLVLSAALAALGKWWGGFFDGWEAVLHVVNFVVSFAIVTALFAAIYKMMPRAKIAWTDVWIGAVVTALLFTIGKFLIGLYLGKSGVTSAFGAAGSMVVLLIWVYYSAQIFLLGAEFTWVYAHHSGSRVVVPGSQPAEAEARKSDATRPETAGVAERPQPVPGQAVAYPRRIDPALFTPQRDSLFDEYPVRNLGIAVASGLVVGAILRRFLPPERLLHRPGSAR
jgi:membrane protein